MSNLTKTAIAIATIAILAAAAWMFYNMAAETPDFESSQPPAAIHKPAETAATDPSEDTDTQIETSAAFDPRSAIDQDLQDIDGQLSGLNGDNANIDEAISGADVGATQ